MRTLVPETRCAYTKLDIYVFITQTIEDTQNEQAIP
jgi:hypothetical protein